MTNETDCISCPRDEKSIAEYHWHPGSVGVHPLCVEHAKDDLITRSEVPIYKDITDPVSGYLTPVGGGPKIMTWEDWARFHRDSND